MKKILFVAPYPPPYSGPESSAKLFFESKIHDHFRVKLFDTNFRTSNSDKGKIGFGAIVIFFKFIYGLIIELVSFKPDLVYYYITATKVGWLFKDIWLIMLVRLFNKKIVIHMRAGHFDYNFSQMSEMSQAIIKRVCKMVDFGLAQSPSLMGQFDEILTKDKVGFVYNMIDTNVYKPAGKPDRKREIFFMGHLSQAKGYNDILKAMPEVLNKYPDLMFSFAGTRLVNERNVFNNYINKVPIVQEDSATVYKSLVEKGYEKNYNYLGIIDESEKINQFNKSEIFILPSYSEGFSMAILEAMAMGLPVITTPVGALADVVEHNVNGIIVSPNDPEKITAALLYLLDNTSVRQKMSKSNLELVDNKFAVDEVIKNYISVFKKVLKN